MAQAASIVAQQVIGFLTAPSTGMGSMVAQLATNSGTALEPPERILNQNMAFDLAERGLVTKYPVVLVYSDRVRNLLTEKFRTFSGKVRTVAEVRISQDRLEGIEGQLRLYVESVTQVLDANRGSWGQGTFFTGGYEVTYEPVRHGGRNFLQIAKVTFEVDLSA